MLFYYNGHLGSIRSLYKKGNIIKPILSTLDGSDYDQGELEDMRSSIENNSLGIAKLIERLLEKNIISMSDVFEIFNVQEGE